MREVSYAPSTAYLKDEAGTKKAFDLGGKEKWGTQEQERTTRYEYAAA